MNKLFYAACFIILLATFTPAQAFATSPTKSFYTEIGVSLGARQGSLSEGQVTHYSSWGFDGGANIGFGFPVLKKLNLTLNAYWTGNYNKTNDQNSEFTHNFDLLAGTNYYLYKGLFLGGGIGFAYLLNDRFIDQNGKKSKVNTFSEPGLGIRFAFGYELTKFSSKYNFGLNAYYMHNFYFSKKLAYLSLGAGFFLRWH